MLHLPNQTRANDVPFGAPIAQLTAVARNLRYQTVQMSHAAGTPHLGSGLSVIDILVATYWRTARIDPRQPSDLGRDRVILSKGHAAAALYAALAARGFFPESWLDEFARHGAKLAEQPAPQCAPGVELALEPLLQLLQSGDESGEFAVHRGLLILQRPAGPRPGTPRVRLMVIGGKRQGTIMTHSRLVESPGLGSN